jgi:hypothetical protein
MKGSAPTAEQSAKAKAVLQQLRLSVVNRGAGLNLN